MQDEIKKGLPEALIFSKKGAVMGSLAYLLLALLLIMVFFYS